MKKLLLFIIIIITMVGCGDPTKNMSKEEAIRYRLEQKIDKRYPDLRKNIKNKEVEYLEEVKSEKIRIESEAKARAKRNLKFRLKDPESLEIENIVAIEQSYYIWVSIDYKAKNSFGAYVKDTYTENFYDIEKGERYNRISKEYKSIKKDYIIKVNKIFGEDGFNIFSYNEKGYSKEGYDKEGYNEKGYNKEGYDKEGYNEKGYNKEGYDKEGYNGKGYNKEGYDKEGYNEKGYNKEGYDKEGYNEKGYNKEGYDKEGYNKIGYNKEGEFDGKSRNSDADIEINYKYIYNDFGEEIGKKIKSINISYGELYNREYVELMKNYNLKTSGSYNFHANFPYIKVYINGKKILQKKYKYKRNLKKDFIYFINKYPKLDVEICCDSTIAKIKNINTKKYRKIINEFKD